LLSILSREVPVDQLRVSLGLQAVYRHPDRVAKLNAFFDTYRSGDEYRREAITHMMAFTSHFPGGFLRRNWTRD
jgi:hypothetical protein